MGITIGVAFDEGLMANGTKWQEEQSGITFRSHAWGLTQSPITMSTRVPLGSIGKGCIGHTSRGPKDLPFGLDPSMRLPCGIVPST